MEHLADFRPEPVWQIIQSRVKALFPDGVTQRCLARESIEIIHKETELRVTFMDLILFALRFFLDQCLHFFTLIVSGGKRIHIVQ